MGILNSSVVPYAFADGNERKNEAHVPLPRTTDLRAGVFEGRQLILLRQAIASSGVTFRATLRERFLGETGHERGAAGTVCGLCRCADRGDRTCRSGGAVA